MTDETVLIVQADSAETSLGWATLGGRRWRCTVGAFTTQKRGSNTAAKTFS